MMNLSVQPDRTLIRAGARSVRYVLVSFTAPQVPGAATRLDVNIAFVIDRSGSMGGIKIELARSAVVQALQMLRGGDRFSVVGYDHQVDVIVPSTAATPEAVRNAIDQVNTLKARGDTDLCGGWLRGCEQIAAHLTVGQTGRCILLTDGLANRGITDRETLAGHARELCERGVTTTTMGVGADFDERLLQALAESGAGHFYFVESAVQIPDYLTSELKETIEIVARDVAVGVRARGIEVECLNRFTFQREDSDSVTVRLGDLVSHQEVSLVFRLQFPRGAEGATQSAVFSVQDAEGALRAPDTDVIWTFRDHAANDAQPRNVVVDRAVAQLYAARAQAEAVELNRAGRFDEATRRLESAARRISAYAGQDPVLLALIENLTERHVVYQRAMSAMELKAEHYASLNVARMRDSSGRARRGPNS